MKILIDGSYMAHRQRYSALGKMERSDGVRNGVIKGFLRSLAFTIRHLHAANYHTIVVWDGGRSEFRTNLYPEYKVKEKTEEDRVEDAHYYEQIKILRKDFLPALGVRTGCIGGVEADDLISLLAVSNPNPPTLIVTGDTDFHQLVSENILLLAGDTETIDLSMVHERWGTTGYGCAIAKALIGDSSDKIKGVEGIGKVRAKTLTPYYDQILDYLRQWRNGIASPDWVLEPFAKQKFMQKLRDGMPILDRNLKLVALPTYATDDHFPNKQALLDFLVTVANAEWLRDTPKFVTLCRTWELDDILAEVGSI